MAWIVLFNCLDQNQTQAKKSANYSRDRMNDQIVALERGERVKLDDGVPRKNLCHEVTCSFLIGTKIWGSLAFLACLLFGISAVLWYKLRLFFYKKDKDVLLLYLRCSLSKPYC